VTSEKIIRGGRAIDYHISMDMAKELAMVERNEEGKQARQYFIECEKRLIKSVPAIPYTGSRHLR
jgi:anti-repressor protein